MDHLAEKAGVDWKEVDKRRPIVEAKEDVGKYSPEHVQDYHAADVMDLQTYKAILKRIRAKVLEEHQRTQRLQEDDGLELTTSKRARVLQAMGVVQEEEGDVVMLDAASAIENVVYW